jgi:hypothetical protein
VRSGPGGDVQRRKIIPKFLQVRAMILVVSRAFGSQHSPVFLNRKACVGTSLKDTLPSYQRFLDVLS